MRSNQAFIVLWLFDYGRRNGEPLKHVKYRKLDTVSVELHRTIS